MGQWTAADSFFFNANASIAGHTCCYASGRVVESGRRVDNLKENPDRRQCNRGTRKTVSHQMGERVIDNPRLALLV